MRGRQLPGGPVSDRRGRRTKTLQTSAVSDAIRPTRPTTARGGTFTARVPMGRQLTVRGRARPPSAPADHDWGSGSGGQARTEKTENVERRASGVNWWAVPPCIAIR